MAKSQPEDQHFDLRVKSSGKEGQRLRVVEIRYVPTPEAEERLSRAIEVLLKAGTRNISQPKDTKNHQAPAKDASIGGGESDYTPP